MAWTHGTHPPPYLPSDTTDTMREARRWAWPIASVTVVILAIGALAGLLEWAMSAIHSVDQTVYMSPAGPTLMDLPAILLALFVVISIVPVTFGVTLAFGAIALALIIPFVRESEARRRQIENDWHGYSEPHDHIPESGFERGIH